MSIEENKEPPRSIQIGNFKYSFKDILVNDFTYRFKHRISYNIVLKIKKEEIY